MRKSALKKLPLSSALVSRECWCRDCSDHGTAARNGNRESTYKREKVVEVAVRIDEEYLRIARLVNRNSLRLLEAEVDLHDVLQAARWRVPWLRSISWILLVIKGLIAP